MAMLSSDSLMGVKMGHARETTYSSFEWSSWAGIIIHGKPLIFQYRAVLKGVVEEISGVECCSATPKRKWFAQHILNRIVKKKIPVRIGL